MAAKSKMADILENQSGSSKRTFGYITVVIPIDGFDVRVKNAFNFVLFFLHMSGFWMKAPIEVLPVWILEGGQGGCPGSGIGHFLFSEIWDLANYFLGLWDDLVSYSLGLTNFIFYSLGFRLFILYFLGSAYPYFLGSKWGQSEQFLIIIFWDDIL